MTVDTANRKIEASLKDRTIVQIAVFDTPEMFVWPQEGESWTIQQCNGIWMLDRRLGGGDDLQIQDLQPGEGKISADVIKTPSGKSVIVVDDSMAREYQTINYNGEDWVVEDIETGTTILNGVFDPTDDIGSDGNYYLNTDTNYLFGPKKDGVWPLGISLVSKRHGAFQSNVTQSISSTSTAYKMAFEVVDLSNGVTVENNTDSPTTKTRITFAYSGVYNIQWSGQFDNTSTSLQDVNVWLRKNGTDVSGSNGVVSIPASHGGIDGHIVTGWNFIVQVTAGDYYEFMWSASNTSVRLKYYPEGASPITPSTASIILTAQEV